MPTGSLSISIDTATVIAQLGELRELLQRIPNRPARRFYRKVSKAIHVGRLERADGDGSIASGASNLGFVFRVDGLSELIRAATRRAEKFNVHGPFLSGD